MSEETFRWVISATAAFSTLCIIVMAVAALMIYKVIARLQVKIEKFVETTVPIVQNVKRISDDTAVKISDIATRAKEIAANAKDMSDVAREQAHRWSEVGKDMADRTQAQVARVDAVVDDTVDQVQVVGASAKAAVLKPVREAGGVLAGIKAAISTYSSSTRRPQIDHVTQDEEMFI